MGNYAPIRSNPFWTLLLLTIFFITVMVLSVYSSLGFSLPIVSAQSTLPALEQSKRSTVERPHQPSTAEPNNSFA